MTNFVCIEGVSYVGKSTLFENLAKENFYKANRIAIGYDKYYKYIKQSNDYNLKFNFYREELYARSCDYLKIDKKFVTDRYYLSIIAYYNVYLKRDILASEANLFGSLRQPDITLLLTANNESIKKRDKKRIVNNYNLLNIIQKEFLRVSNFLPNVHIIKTDEYTIEEVFCKAVSIIKDNDSSL